MRSFLIIFLIAITGCTKAAPTEDTVRANIEETLAAAHQAWATGGVDTIIGHEHPNIHKLISFDNVIVGRDASRADLEAALQAFDFKVTEFSIENFELRDNFATFYAIITLEGKPKGEGYPFAVTSRTLSVWVRDETNPDQWLSFREVVQATPIVRD